jgi:hypothetical protein
MSGNGYSPYPGPRPYRWSEADNLCGRDKETADLRDLVVSYKASLLYAQSGAGKTSLIARLGPTLQKEGTCVLTSRVGVGSAAGPGGNVFVESALATLTFGEDELAVTGASPSAVGNHLFEGLLAALEARGLVGSEPRSPKHGWELKQQCLVVFDQLEELFTTNLRYWTQRQGFFQEVAHACERIADLNVLLVIREDYVAQLDRYASLLPNALRIRYRLERLRKPEALSAVVQPLSASGVQLPPEIAGSIVCNLLKTRVTTQEENEGAKASDRRDEETIEIEGEFVEPIHLQLACQNLWDILQRAPKASAPIRRNAAGNRSFRFERNGESFVTNADTIGSIDDSLRAAYERAVHAAARKGVREATLRAFVERRLITREQTRGFVDRATFRRQGIPDEAMETLIASRVIRREPRAGAPWYELTHDRMIQPVVTSNRRARERRVRNAVGGGLSVLVTVLAFGGIFGYRSSQPTAEAVEAGKTFASWRNQLADVTVEASSLRPAKGTSVHVIASAGEQTPSDLAPPAVASQSYDDLLKSLKADIEARQRLIESLRAEIIRKDELIAQLTPRPIPPPRRRHAPASNAPSPAAPSMPPLLLKDIKATVVADRVPDTNGIYNFSIRLEMPADRRNQIQEVRYSFDHPTFRGDKTRVSKDAERGFKVGYVGWGCLTNVVANIVPVNGEPMILPIDMCAQLEW